MIYVLLIVALIVLIITILKYPPVSLAFFLTAGFIKATLMLKFSFFRVADYTVLCAILVLIAMAYSFARSGGRIKDIISIPVGMYLFLVGILFFGLAYTSAPNYGLEKSSRFATLTLIAFLAPVVFSNNNRDIKLLMWVVLAVGITLTVGTIMAPQSIEPRPEGRAEFMESSSLGTATQIGMSLVITFVFAVMTGTPKLLRTVSLAIMPFMMAGMILTGSRGPFAGLILTCLVAIFICRRGISKAWLPFIVGAAVVSLMVSFVKLPERVTSRIATLWESGYTAKRAVGTRTEMFVWAVRRSPERLILGHGTGAYAVDRGGQDERSYPHNIVIELLYEQGLVGAIIISLFLWLIFRRWRQAARFVRLYELDIGIFQAVHIAGLLFLFAFMQALKSGDINDNRFMFFCAGLVLATLNCVRRSIEDITFENEPITEEVHHLEGLEFQDTQVTY